MKKGLAKLIKLKKEEEEEEELIIEEELVFGRTKLCHPKLIFDSNHISKQHCKILPKKEEKETIFLLIDSRFSLLLFFLFSSRKNKTSTFNLQLYKKKNTQFKWNKFKW